MNEPQATPQATGTEAPVAVPRDKDAKALVAAIHKQAADPAGVSIFQLWTRLSVIQGLAERLAVLLDERDAAREELVTALDAFLIEIEACWTGAEARGWIVDRARPNLRAALACVKAGS
jgi:hypothetical protein